MQRLTFRELLKEVYLDWVNNYISLQVFADAYNLTYWQAHTIIAIGRSINNADANIKLSTKK